MTPDKARDLLDGAAHGEWQWDVTGNVAAVDGDGWEDIAAYVSESNAPLIVAAPTLAAMRAEMRPEYRTEEWQGQYPGWVPTSPWTAEKLVGGPDPHTRIVRRYVTEPEAIS